MLILLKIIPLLLLLLVIYYCFISVFSGALQVFIVPFLTDIHADAGLNITNYFGAAIWSGFMVIYYIFV